MGCRGSWVRIPPLRPQEGDFYMKAVVLLSGGLDSATVFAIAKENYTPYALSFSYGQRHGFELECARKIAKGFVHQVIDLDLRAFGGSALTSDIDVPKMSYDPTAIPITYVPARNTIFLSIALAFAETINASTLFIGAHAVDSSNYPDCRPEFLAAFEKVANLGTKKGLTTPFHICAPLLMMNKAQIIQEGMKRSVDYSITSSCYDPSHNGLACGGCDACTLRLEGFRANGLQDPISYRMGPCR